MQTQNSPTQAIAPGASAQAIQAHYDVSNEFYQLWLDPHMVYSCALWHEDEDADIVTAQFNKIDWHLQHAGARAGAHLLDIGCGWGALMERAVTHAGASRITGLTISKAQYDWVNARKNDRVELRFENWADHKPEQLYDGITSVCAFEHFARPDQMGDQRLEAYRTFFAFCHRVLRPQGGLSLQCITYGNFDRSRANGFIADTIFPESDLAYLDEIVQSCRGLFEIEVLRNDRRQYVRTLRYWLENLRAKKIEAIALVGAEMVASYDKYLSLSIVGLHTGMLNLSRIAMRRLDSPAC